MAKDNLSEVCSDPPIPEEDQIVAKCDLCSKPLGPDHYQAQGKHFCCDKAAGQYFAQQKRYEDYQARENAGKWKKTLIRAVVLLIVLAAVIAGVVYYVTNKEQVDEKLREGRERIEEATGTGSE